MKNTIGQRIRALRKAKELTQENLAYELGITKGAYNKIETGKTNVSISRLDEIAKILEINTSDFFKEEQATSQLSDPPKNYGFATKSDIEELVKMIQDLSKEIHQLKNSGKKATAKKYKKS